MSAGTPAKKLKYGERQIVAAQVGRSRVLKCSGATGVVKITSGLRSPVYALAQLHASSLGSTPAGTAMAGCPLISFDIQFWKVSGSYVMFKAVNQATGAALNGSYVSFDYMIFEDVS